MRGVKVATPALTTLGLPGIATARFPAKLPALEPGQYTSIRFTEHLALEGIRPSIGSVGDAFDALMETIIGLFKAECMVPPVEYEQAHYAVPTLEMQPT